MIFEHVITLVCDGCGLATDMRLQKDSLTLLAPGDLIRMATELDNRQWRTLPYFGKVAVHVCSDACQQIVEREEERTL
jgi:hypothetical protein